MKSGVQTAMSPFRQNMYLKWNIGIALVVCFSGIGLLFYYWNRLPPELPIFYSRTWGEEQLGSPTALFMLVCSPIVIGIINTVFAFWMYLHFPLYAKILMIGISIFALFTTITAVQILLLIT